jgi:hypothetical protein
MRKVDPSMSAINVLVQKDVVSFVTDGAEYDTSGILKAAASRTFALPHIRAVVGVRGPAMMVPTLAYALGAAATYDDLKKRIAVMLPDAMSHIRTVFTSMGEGVPREIQVFVGGWTDGGMADAYVMTDQVADGAMTWSLSRIVDLAMAPCDLPVRQEVRPFLEGRRIEDLDPRNDGVKILDAQRRHATEHDAGRMIHGVGCFGQLTAVYRDGRIVMEVLCHWPEDRIGNPIDPTLAHASLTEHLAKRRLKTSVGR